MTPRPSNPAIAQSTGRTPTKQGVDESPSEVSLAKKVRVSPPESSGLASSAGKGMQMMESWEDKTLSVIFRVTLQVRIDSLRKGRGKYLFYCSQEGPETAIITLDDYRLNWRQKESVGLPISIAFF